MATHTLSQQDWDIRLYIYQVMTTTGQPPDYQSIAKHFMIEPELARQALHRLNDAHALFLRPESNDIMMAFPLSGIQTDYQVMVDDVTLYANCAWDSLGIPAMLGKDADITVTHPTTHEPIYYSIKDGNLQSPDGMIHFAIPFAQWYDNLIDT